MIIALIITRKRPASCLNLGRTWVIVSSVGRDITRQAKMHTTRTLILGLTMMLIQTTLCQDISDVFSDDTDEDDDIITVVELPPLPLSPARVWGPSPLPVAAPVSQQVSQTKTQHYHKMTGRGQSSLSAICRTQSSGGGWGYFPFPGSCNQYVHCDRQQRAFLETCAVGTFYNGGKCVRSEEVICAWDPCQRLPNGRSYSDGQTCYGYYKCLGGRSVSGICPSGFAFNSLKQGCIPDNSCQQPTQIIHSCFSGTTHPVPGQPHMFYLWDGGDGMTPMECPRGLWYNPRVCVCDWVVPGQVQGTGCQSMFNFGFNGDFLEEFNKAIQTPNTAVSIFQKSALFGKGGRIVVWMMNDIDMDSEWALCFEFMTQTYKGEVALISNDWKRNEFTYKITYFPSKSLLKGYFRMKDGVVVELLILGVKPTVPHFLRVAKLGSTMKMRVDNMAPASVKISAGVASARSPMVVGAAANCNGFVGYFDELKFFRCVPDSFFKDYVRLQ